MRLLSIVLLLSLLFLGCGTTNIGFSSNPGAGTATGIVSIVRLSVVDGSVTVTAVTLLGSGTASDFNFCGDHRDQFPMNQFIIATFTPGSSCATIISVRNH